MSGGQMDEALSNTLSNVNELIEAANNTIQNTLGGAATTGDSKKKIRYIYCQSKVYYKRSAELR